MRIRIFILIFFTLLLNSCIVHQISSSEEDDVYFTKKDILPIKDKVDEEVEEVTGVEEVDE